MTSFAYALPRGPYRLKNPDLPADKEISDGYRLASHRRWEPHWHHPADIVGREELGGSPL